MKLNRYPAARVALFFFVLTTLLTGGAPPAVAAGRQDDGAAAAWTPRVEARQSGDGAAELWVNGKMALRFRSTLGGYLPTDRIEVAAGRLRAAISGGATAGDVLVDSATSKQNPRLKVAGLIIATATPEEAKESKTTAALLAKNWAWALKQALATPGLAVSAKSILVPLGESRTLTITGAARGMVSIAALSSADPVTSKVIAWETSEGDSPLLVVRGQTPGRETLVLNREGATVTLSIAVQPYAGKFIAPTPVTVTGRQASAERIAQQVAARAQTAALPLPGATVKIEAKTLQVRPMVAGESQTVNVPLAITGPEMIAVRQTVAVPVLDRVLPEVPTATLLYSNNPERISRFQTLFTGRVKEGNVATRLLYHHQSALPQAAWFVVELINDADRPAEVQVVGGDVGPARDTVWVGYRAASSFLKDQRVDLGIVVVVPARSRLALTAIRIAPGLTISGIRRLRLLSGPAPLVRIAADLPGDLRTLPFALALLPLSPERSPDLSAALSEHVYPEPRKQLQATYAVGGQWTFLSIGRQPVTTAGGERKLDGNYGVFYDIELTLKNPTDRSAPAKIVFEPSAGLAGAVFEIDDDTIEIPQTNLPTETTLARYTLDPGASRTIRVRTVPLAGSNYPARVIVRP